MVSTFSHMTMNLAFCFCAFVLLCLCARFGCAPLNSPLSLFAAQHLFLQGEEKVHLQQVFADGEQAAPFVAHTSTSAPRAREAPLLLFLLFLFFFFEGKGSCVVFVSANLVVIVLLCCAHFAAVCVLGVCSRL